MQKPRKIPQRQCVGCREMKEKKALLRIVRTPEGQILLDGTGKKIRTRRLCVPRPRLPEEGTEEPVAGAGL